MSATTTATKVLKNKCGIRYVANYAIKGTSVEILDSSELSSGASVPYFGC
jgi:hypothetical protein